jgi:hypothetical protein
MSEMVDMERLARVWRKMQDKRDTLRREYDEADQEVERQQAVVATALLSAMNGLKAEKLTTSSGVVERQKKVLASGADWPAIRRFVVENDAWEMLHKRISTTFIDKWMKEHDAAPPGVNVFTEFKVVVKKPGGKALPADE